MATAALQHCIVGLALGCADGTAVGLALGCADGTAVGLVLGCTDGTAVGLGLGCADGTAVGLVLGCADGTAVGLALGCADGTAVGLALGCTQALLHCTTKQLDDASTAALHCRSVEHCSTEALPKPRQRRRGHAVTAMVEVTRHLA